MELTLDKARVESIKNYIDSQEYAIGTKRLYKLHLQKFSDKYVVLNKSTLKASLRKFTKSYHRALFKIINEYCFWEDIDFKTTIPRIKQKPRKIPETLSLNEIKIMIDSVPDEYKLFIRSIFNFGAGLRISEAIRIAWHRFDWDDWLYYPPANETLKEYGVMGKFKTEEEREMGTYLILETKRDKTFPVIVPKKVMQEYYNLAIKLNILDEFRKPNYRGAIFDFGAETYLQDLFQIDPKMWRWKYTKHAYDWVIYNLIKKYCEPALNKKIHPHMLRHSKATYLLKEGVPLEEISKQLGHADLRTSMIYAKVSMKKVKESMKNIKTI